MLPSSTHRDTGVLLIGHGTRDDRGTREFFELGRRLGQLAESLPAVAAVQPCLLEFQEPTISQAWQALIQKRVSRVVVAPLLLFSAGHAKSDIPDEIASLSHQIGSPIDCVRYAQPLSRHADLIAVARQRLLTSLQSLPADAGRTAIVMVGRGSRDPCASSDMRLLSELLIFGKDQGPSLASQFALTHPDVWTTFYAMAQPRLTDTLDRVAQSGKYERIIVQPHLLFAGRLFDAIGRQVDNARATHPHIQWITSAYLGPCHGIASAIAGRVGQAIGKPYHSCPPSDSWRLARHDGHGS